jgi:hypothetical protein
LVRLLIPLLWFGSLASPISAQELPSQLLERASHARNEIERDRLLRLGFETALNTSPVDSAAALPLVIDRPWLAELNFRESCALARTVAVRDAGAAEKLARAVGLHNPALALREAAEYLSLPTGPRLFEEFVLAAPDEAVAMASGSSRSAQSTRELLSAAHSPTIAVLLRLSNQQSIDQPRRRRMAIFATRIARGELSYEAALKLAGDTQRFFAMLVDMRMHAPPADTASIDRTLSNESLLLCLAARENRVLTLSGDLIDFPARDLYVLLAMGLAEATPEVFAAIFDRLLLPKWKTESPKGSSLLTLLDRTNNWALRDFAAGAVAAHRFDGLLTIAGSELIGRLVRGLDQTADPLKEGMRLAEIAEATGSPTLLAQMGELVSQEFTRCRTAGDLRGQTIYGLLAAKLSVSEIAAPYAAFFRSSETLDTALLCGAADQCVERHFFYDDDDGVRSFQSFLKTYQRDSAWTVEQRDGFVHLIGRGPTGRRIAIFANIPIDTHLPENRALEGEARRRQQAIAADLQARGLAATILVHRGHSFWVEQTLTYVTSSAGLVILGSCGGTSEIHAVLARSHDAQVIATRGIGETEINDHILKSMNDRILTGPRVIQWKDFWRELSANRKSTGLFRDYVAPNQDPSMVFLRSYYRYLDTLN